MSPTRRGDYASKRAIFTRICVLYMYTNIWRINVTRVYFMCTRTYDILVLRVSVCVCGYCCVFENCFRTLFLAGGGVTCSLRHPIHICRVGARPAQQDECHGERRVHFISPL